MSASQNYQAYQEVVDFIASSNPAKVLAFKLRMKLNREFPI